MPSKPEQLNLVHIVQDYIQAVLNASRELEQTTAKTVPGLSHLHRDMKKWNEFFHEKYLLAEGEKNDKNTKALKWNLICIFDWESMK